MSRCFAWSPKSPYALHPQVRQRHGHAARAVDDLDERVAPARLRLHAWRRRAMCAFPSPPPASMATTCPRACADFASPPLPARRSIAALQQGRASSTMRSRPPTATSGPSATLPREDGAYWTVARTAPWRDRLTAVRVPERKNAASPATSAPIAARGARAFEDRECSLFGGTCKRLGVVAEVPYGDQAPETSASPTSCSPHRIWRTIKPGWLPGPSRRPKTPNRREQIRRAPGAHYILGRTKYDVSPQARPHL